MKAAEGVTRMGARLETVPYAMDIPSIERRDGRVVGYVIRRYGLSLLFVAVALLASVALQPLFPHPFLFLFFAGVVASAWFGGMLPGLFSVLISTLAVDYFFVPPLHSFGVKTPSSSYFPPFFFF